MKTSLSKLKHKNRGITMRYPQYQSDLQHIYQSEVYGANVFKVAGRLTLNRKKKDQWALLYDLEIQTLERFLLYIKETGQQNNYPHIWALKGYIEGLVLGLLPWSVAMRLLAKETQSFISIWHRLKINSKGSEKEFFNYVYAHEKAIEAFAKRELMQGNNSIGPVRSLLGLSN